MKAGTKNVRQDMEATVAQKRPIAARRETLPATLATAATDQENYMQWYNDPKRPGTDAELARGRELRDRATQSGDVVRRLKSEVSAAEWEIKPLVLLLEAPDTVKRSAKEMEEVTRQVTIAEKDVFAKERLVDAIQADLSACQAKVASEQVAAATERNAARLAGNALPSKKPAGHVPDLADLDRDLEDARQQLADATATLVDLIQRANDLQRELERAEARCAVMDVKQLVADIMPAIEGCAAKVGLADLAHLYPAPTIQIDELTIRARVNELRAKRPVWQPKVSKPDAPMSEQAREIRATDGASAQAAA